MTDFLQVTVSLRLSRIISDRLLDGIWWQHPKKNEKYGNGFGLQNNLLDTIITAIYSLEAFIIVSQNMQVRHSYLILWCFCVNLKRILHCSVLLTQQNWGECSAMQILAYQFVHCQFHHCLVLAAWRTYKHTQLLTSFFWAPKWQQLSTAMTHVLCVCQRVGSFRDHSHVVVVGCCQRKVNCQLSGAEQNLVCVCAVLKQMK